MAGNDEDEAVGPGADRSRVIARRKLLRKAAYVAPAVLATLAATEGTAFAQSCNPNQCRPACGPCQQNPCGPTGGCT
jgi:hypothetical protein